jgi:hypothetical protein
LPPTLSSLATSQPWSVFSFEYILLPGTVFSELQSSSRTLCSVYVLTDGLDH